MVNSYLYEGMHNEYSFTPSQIQALDELFEIEAVSEGSVEVIRESVQGISSGDIEVNVVLDCSSLQVEGQDKGIKFEPHESVWFSIPLSFPRKPPSMFVRHTRFAGYENVMRGGGICLFLSPDTEWDPGLGMAGFFQERVWTWFERVARGELEADGGPFHFPLLHYLPPIPAVIIHRKEDPDTGDRAWLGFTRLRHRESRKDIKTLRPPLVQIELVGWTTKTSGRRQDEWLGAAILLPRRFGFEFPETIADLIVELERSGVEQRKFLEHLVHTARGGRRGRPLLVTVGTPIEGVEPSQRRRHYLTTLYVGPDVSAKLWDAGRTGGSRLREAILEEVNAWTKSAHVAVCYSREARSNVLERRDTGSPLAWFKGRSVAVWGCGALGAPIALQLCRAGVKRIVLRDNGYVKPGHLVRQPFTDKDLDLLKYDVLGHRLKAVNPDVVVCGGPDDIRTARFGPSAGWTDGADLLINATASRSVQSFLDEERATASVAPIPILTVGVDHTAERGYARLVLPEYGGGVVDIDRSVKLNICGDTESVHFADAFFPSQDDPRSEPFHPEPGCSDSTFIGSASDMAVLSGTLMNWAAQELGKQPQQTASAFLVTQAHVDLPETARRQARLVSGRWIDMCDERSAYRIRLAPNVQIQIETHILDAHERLGAEAETGGPLYGEWDAALGVLWVDEAGSAPSDSIETANRFLCGVEGLEEDNERLLATTRGATGFIGTWHTHPRTAPVPSEVDYSSMVDFFARPEILPRTFLMIIVGLGGSSIRIKPHVFHRHEFRLVDQFS